MFYGREWEMDQILSAQGSSFLFGGRQLGKTVLLRNAAKTFHRPTEGHVACWLDLKDKGIGTAHSLDKLWEVLGSELKAIGVLPDTFRPASRPDAFLRETAEWLAKDSGRRILLLLDESDDFLNADGVDSAQEFHRCSLIKGLMDRTERRFKVVFAGLHNVQRSTRTVNQPLAHFGEPICIGPMLRGEEAKAAADLVERPLRACGFTFDPAQRSQIITRVLARTNYYPSLIQLFCQKLVEHCFNTGRNRFDQRNSPPWRLTLDHIKAAEKLEAVRQSIREKFILTLDLDKRFRLIAFLMAHHDGDHAGSGFHIQEIARKSREWWPAGFASSRSDDVFRDLLEEMIGLGVLRRVSGHGTYALRSPNLVSLLGSAAEVEAELLNSMNWEVKAEYDPQHFHQTLDESGMERSPFTAHQEARLFSSRANHVAVVTGCPLSGLAPEFAKRLRLLSRKTPFELVETAAESEFDHALHALSQRADPRVVIAVPPGTAWTPAWLSRAFDKLSALKSEGKFVTVIFTQGSDQPLAMFPPAVEHIPLGPWHSSALIQWFERASLGGDEARQQEVLSATGGWPRLAESYLLERQKGRSLADACAILRAEQEQEYSLTLRELGVDAKAVPIALSIIAELAGESAEDVRLVEVQEFANISGESLRALLRPLELQQAVTLSEQKIRLNPVLARCLRRCQSPN